jgi:tight adherence protein C
MFTYLIFGAVFIAVTSLVVFFCIPKLISTMPKKSLSKLTYYDNLPKAGDQKASILEKTFAPVLKKALAGARRILPRSLIDSVKEKFEHAGIQDVVRLDIFLAIKFFLPFVLLFTLIFLTLFFIVPPMVRVAVIFLVPFTYMFPDYYLKGRISKRQEEIRKGLPNALDLLTISVEAGLGFDQALYKVASNSKGALGEEFKRTLKEMEIGVARKEALKNLAKRTDVSELNSFIFSIIQADIFGISIGKVLRVQAGEMRIKRKQIAEEKGMKAPVKLIFPTILFLFPALMVIIIGPAAINIMDTLKTIVM